MTKYYCDKCGKEIRPLTDEWYRVEIVDNSGSLIWLGYNDKMLLCEDCCDKIKQFITENTINEDE